jgi:hypothetical protein
MRSTRKARTRALLARLRSSTSSPSYQLDHLDTASLGRAERRKLLGAGVTRNGVHAATEQMWSQRWEKHLKRRGIDRW